MAPLVLYCKRQFVFYKGGMDILPDFMEWPGLFRARGNYCLAAMPEAPAETSRLLMGCNGHTFGCRLADDWPETYYVGFTACEGRNRFYDFTLVCGENRTPVMEERVSD